MAIPTGVASIVLEVVTCTIVGYNVSNLDVTKLIQTIACTLSTVSSGWSDTRVAARIAEETFSCFTWVPSFLAVGCWDTLFDKCVIGISVFTFAATFVGDIDTSLDTFKTIIPFSSFTAKTFTSVMTCRTTSSISEVSKFTFAFSSVSGTELLSDVLSWISANYALIRAGSNAGLTVIVTILARVVLFVLIRWAVGRSWGKNAVSISICEVVLGVAFTYMISGYATCYII